MVVPNTSKVNSRLEGKEQCHTIVLRSVKEIKESKRDVVVISENEGLEKEDKVKKELHKPELEVKEVIPPSRESASIVIFP